MSPIVDQLLFWLIVSISVILITCLKLWLKCKFFFLLQVLQYLRFLSKPFNILYLFQSFVVQPHSCIVWILITLEWLSVLLWHWRLTQLFDLKFIALLRLHVWRFNLVWNYDGILFYLYKFLLRILLLTWTLIDVRSVL
jgi:hypothetical protein